jgi:hypothetical protein
MRHIEPQLTMQLQVRLKSTNYNKSNNKKPTLDRLLSKCLFILVKIAELFIMFL